MRSGSLPAWPADRNFKGRPSPDISSEPSGSWQRLRPRLSAHRWLRGAVPDGEAAGRGSQWRQDMRQCRGRLPRCERLEHGDDRSSIQVEVPDGQFAEPVPLASAVRSQISCTAASSKVSCAAHESDGPYWALACEKWRYRTDRRPMPRSPALAQWPAGTDARLYPCSPW